MLKKMTILSALLALILVDLLKAQGESKDILANQSW